MRPFIILNYETYRYLKEYSFLETRGSKSLEKCGKKSHFVRRKFIIVSEVKCRPEHQRKDGSKELPISDMAAMTLFWIKYSNKNKKPMTFFNNEFSIQNREIFIFHACRYPMHKNSHNKITVIKHVLKL